MPAAVGIAGSKIPPGAVLSALPVAVYTTDPDGWITFYNAAAAQLWGREPKLFAERWCGSLRLFRPDGEPLPLEDCPMARVLKTGLAVHGEAIVAERPDGSRVMLLAHPAPLFDETGRLSGAVNMLADISDRHASERGLGQLSAIVESSDDAILSKDLNGIIQTWNKGAERLFGYTAGEAVGRSILILIPPDRHNEEPGILSRIRAGERVDHYETVRRRKDGTLIDISLTVSPVRGANGEVVGASKIARDISERKRAEATKDLLLHEIKHRVKNTLGTVQAIATQTFRQAPPEEREAFGARLRAMSDAHDLLTGQDWGPVAVGDVAERAVKPFDRERFTLTGDASTLPAAKALLLAMALHELSTNAVKYGALSAPDGRVAIDWSGGNGRLVLNWRESGGPPVSAPERRGFGTRLIQRALAGEGGTTEFEFAPAGLVCRMEIGTA